MGLVREYNQALSPQKKNQQPEEIARPANRQPENSQTDTRNELINQPNANGSNALNSSRTPSKPVPNGPLDLETQEQIRELLAQGYRLSIEHDVLRDVGC